MYSLILAAACAAPGQLPDYRWVPVPSDPAQVALLYRGRQIGCWDHESCYFKELFPDGSWSKAGEVPADAPHPPRALAGNDEVGRRDGKERSTVNGREVSKDELSRRVGAPDLPNDAGKRWIVAVAPDAAGKAKAAADLAPFKDKYRVQCYVAGDWATKDRDGKLVYLPGITVADASGRQLHHQADMDAGRLRKAEPNFDPSKTPDLSNGSPKPGPLPWPVLPSVPFSGGSAAVWAVASLVALIVWRKPNVVR